MYFWVKIQRFPITTISTEMFLNFSPGRPFVPSAFWVFVDVSACAYREQIVCRIEIVVLALQRSLPSMADDAGDKHLDVWQAALTRVVRRQRSTRRPNSETIDTFYMQETTHSACPHVAGTD